MNRFVSVFSPGEWSMIFAQNCRYCLIIFIFEVIYDQKSCIFLIRRIDLFFCQAAHARDFSVHVICMGGSVTRDSSSCLSPAGCPWRVRMYHTADLWKCTVQFQMSRCIRGWIVSSLNLISLKIHDHHIIRCQFVIVNTTGFDGKISGFTVNLADISPGKGYQIVFWKQHIGFIYRFF